jgi:hypothetical protein
MTLIATIPTILAVLASMDSGSASESDADRAYTRYMDYSYDFTTWEVGGKGGFYIYTVTNKNQFIIFS